MPSSTLFITGYRGFAEVRPDVVIFVAEKMGSTYPDKTYPAKFRES